MGADRYYARLRRARILWSAFVAVIWLVYLAGAGVTHTLIDVSIFLGGAWLLGFPRNGAKRAARRAASHQAFTDAVDRESRR